jgi:hypothetical protein
MRPQPADQQPNLPSDLMQQLMTDKQFNHCDARVGVAANSEELLLVID